MSFLDKFFSGAVSFARAQSAVDGALLSSMAQPGAGRSIQPYTVERTGIHSAEIKLYGDIVSERPFDWRTGKPSEGDYIVLSEFLEDLKSVEDVDDLTVRIHSVGGNAYDSIAIHNRLKSLKAYITIIVDGVAMSGGSLIMCAGDKVQVYPASLVMIHRCWSFLFGGYNAEELRGIADGFDAADRAQAAIYRIKTGLSTEELLEMMGAETYMTGQETIDKGFADELVEADDGMDIAASADRRTLFAGGRPVFQSTRKGGIPAAIPTVTPEAEASVAANNQKPANAGSQKGGQKPMANTLEELRTEYPELTAQLEAEVRAAAVPGAIPAAAAPAVPAAQATPAAPSAADLDPAQTERKRIQEIDALAGQFDSETISAAKYGDTACTAQEMAYRAAQKAAKTGGSFLAAMEDDTAASGAQKVGGAASGNPGEGNGEPKTPEEKRAYGAAAVRAMNKKEEK